MAPVITVFLGLCLATACDENPIGPTVPVDRQFVLAPGEGATIEGTVVRMRFEEVTSDSRCPINAVCVQAGDAVVMIRVFDEIGSYPYELHATDVTRKSATHRNVSIEVVDLQPVPFAGRPTDPSAYRATFKVTRSG
jgi:hypothetical protein